MSIFRILIGIATSAGFVKINRQLNYLLWLLMATLTTDTAFERSASVTEQLVPFEIWEVLYDNKTIKFFKPLVLEPTWVPDDPDEPDENEYLQIIYPELAIDVFAETRDELLSWVHSEIRMNWKLFVSKEDAQLNPDTLALKRSYLAVAEVVDG